MYSVFDDTFVIYGSGSIYNNSVSDFHVCTYG